jgi:HK97 family phage prohead protease
VTNKQFNIQIVRSAGLGPLNAVGIATREVVDYADDIVVVSGMETRDADVVLLANHDMTKPIGRARLSASGNEVKAYITFAPEGTTETADEYRKLCKAGVLTDLSIGFNPIERQAINGGGWRYTKWQCMEVSLVAVGCNPAAVIVQRSQKSGRVLSGANATKLQQAHDAAESCRALVADVIGSNTDDSDDPGAKARRQRDLDIININTPPPLTRAERMAVAREIEIWSLRNAP